MPSLLRLLSFTCALTMVAATHARVSATLTTDVSARPLELGAKFQVTLAVAIEPGWHIASITHPEGGPVRTDIALAPRQPLKLAGPITGAKPRIEHGDAFDINVETHQGAATFTPPLEAMAEKVRNEALRERSVTKGYPTVIFADARGREFTRTVGYDPHAGPAAYLARLIEPQGQP